MILISLVYPTHLFFRDMLSPCGVGEALSAPQPTHTGVDDGWVRVGSASASSLSTLEFSNPPAARVEAPCLPLELGYDATYLGGGLQPDPSLRGELLR